jgi:RNA polymerase sigma-70 factor (ECF subfamily)
MRDRDSKCGQSADHDPPAALDRVSFAAQYRSAYPRLTLVAIGIIRDRVFAEDIVQEAAIIALQKLDDFTPGTNFRAWMSAIVRHCALNYARKMKNRATFASDPRSFDHSQRLTHRKDQEKPAINSVGALLEDQVALDDEVVAALDTIDETARCCLLLRTVLELSYAEISELLDIPEGTAMSHVHRSKATLRKRLRSG